MKTPRHFEVTTDKLNIESVYKNVLFKSIVIMIIIIIIILAVILLLFCNIFTIVNNYKIL